MIDCRHIERLYPDGHVAALIGVDLTIAAGEYIAVMGPSGSGKSTLLNLIGGLDKPTAGEILFEGVSLAKPGAIDDIRINKIGFIFQAFHLLPTLSAAENVQIPMFESSLNAAARRQARRHALGGSRHEPPPAPSADATFRR